MDGSVRLSSLLVTMSLLLSTISNSSFASSSTLVQGYFEPSSATGVPEGQSKSVIFRTNSSSFCTSFVEARTSDSSVASVAVLSQTLDLNSSSSSSICLVNLTVDGRNLGYATAVLVATDAGGNVVLETTPILEVSVVRTQRVIDLIFTLSVVILVSISYVNMGCTLEWPVIVATMKRPFGPVVGLCCQYLFMPLVSPVCVALGRSTHSI